MKRILLFILLVIVLMFAWSQYQDYQRFHPENSDVPVAQGIDLNYHDPMIVQSYYEAVAQRNRFVTTQWTTNKIDVRNPEENNVEAQAAVAQFAKLEGHMNYLKDKLLASAKAKAQGLSNAAIKSMEMRGLAIAQLQAQEQALVKKERLEALFTTTSDNSLRIGSRGALVYELQKLLKARGYEIPVDGVFQNVTFDALKAFETSKELYPDGKLDMLTLAYLMEE